MVNIPKFPHIAKKIYGEYYKFAATFADAWFCIVIAHVLGIGLGIVLSIAASYAPLGRGF